MKNKKLLLVSSVLLTLIIVITTILIVNKNNIDNEIVMQDNINQINNPFLTLMLEQSDGSYQESTTNTWPSGNYAFNSEKSRCENGGELRWDRETGIVELLSNKSDACYVYFDLYNVVTITNVSTTKTTNSVTLTVTVDAGENPVATYYFSMDGGRSYQTSTSPNYTFSELTPNTSYTFQVYVVDSQGYESNEETIEVTTDNYVNPVVNSVTATNVENDSITVSVLASAGINNVARYYYSSNGGSSYVNTTSNSYTFSGLSAGTTYNIKVYVVDTNGVQSNVYTLTVQTDDTVLLADWVISQYNGTQGNNGIYYHTSSLANSAGDNSYRYAGANPNNYVCFGSDSVSCPSNNLYRIIGVFGSEVKLIKSTSYGYYVWDSGNSNIWNSSTKPDIRSTLNSTYYNNLGTTWQNKIATHEFKVGGMTSDDSATAKEYYNTEVGSSSSSTTDSMKIGLMYVSDYGFAASTSDWTVALYDYGYSTNRDNNWMNLGNNEWTISRTSNNSTNAFQARATSRVNGVNSVDNLDAVRPVFYLTSSTQYVSGSGTQSDPIRIN